MKHIDSNATDDARSVAEHLGACACVEVQKKYRDNNRICLLYLCDDKFQIMRKHYTHTLEKKLFLFRREKKNQ
jgi:hypothetical protein